MQGSPRWEHRPQGFCPLHYWQRIRLAERVLSAIVAVSVLGGHWVVDEALLGGRMRGDYGEDDGATGKGGVLRGDNRRGGRSVNPLGC